MPLEESRNSSLLIGIFGWCAESGRSHEKCLAIGKRDFASVRLARGSTIAVSALETAYDDLRTRCERVPVDPLTEQSVGCPALDHPCLRLTVLKLDKQVHPRVRVDPLDTRHLAAQLHRFVDVKLRRERVMR